MNSRERMHSCIPSVFCFVKHRCSRRIGWKWGKKIIVSLINRVCNRGNQSQRDTTRAAARARDTHESRSHFRDKRDRSLIIRVEFPSGFTIGLRSPLSWRRETGKENRQAKKRLLCSHSGAPIGPPLSAVRAFARVGNK